MASLEAVKAAIAKHDAREKLDDLDIRALVEFAKQCVRVTERQARYPVSSDPRKTEPK